MDHSQTKGKIAVDKHLSQQDCRSVPHVPVAIESHLHETYSCKNRASQSTNDKSPDSTKTKQVLMSMEKYTEGWSLTHSDGKLTKVTYPNGTATELGYIGSTLSSVKFPDNSIWLCKESTIFSEIGCKDRLGSIRVRADGTIDLLTVNQHRILYPDGVSTEEPLKMTGSSLKELYEQSAPLIDRNKDGNLTKKELRDAVVNPSIEGAVARFVATAYTSFDSLSSLAWKYPTFEPAITKGDIDVCASSIDDKVDNWTKLARNLNGQEQKVKNITDNFLAMDKENHHRSLYSRQSGIDCIRSSNVQQGLLGDCFFHAALSSLSQARPDLVQRMIHDNKDGTYDITFGDMPKKPVRIPNLTQAEKILYGSETPGGLWPLLIEKAYGEKIRQARIPLPFDDRLPYELTDAGGFDSTVFSEITGQKAERLWVFPLGTGTLNAKLKSACEQHIPVTASTGSLSTPAGLSEGHAFSILGYDANKQLISIRNPAGQEDSAYGGTFQMTLKQFKDNFSYITFASH